MASGGGGKKIRRKGGRRFKPGFARPALNLCHNAKKHCLMRAGLK
jgi:hypothetical protein